MQRRALSRRAMLQRTGLGVLGLSVLGAAGTGPELRAAGGTGTATGFAPLNRFGRMMQDYFIRRIREVEQRGVQQRASLRSKPDAEAYVAEVRRKILQCFGPFPKKTPLNARVTGVLRRNGYYQPNREAM